MQINISAEKLLNAQKLLGDVKKAIPKAVSLAFNRVLEGIRTDAVDQAKTRYYAKPSDIRKNFSLRRTSGEKLQALFTSRGTRKNLREYFISPKSPRKNMQGLQAAVKRDGIKYIAGAFLIKRGSSYKAYFRPKDGHSNVKPLTSPVIPQILKNSEITSVLEQKAGERFNKRFEHEISRILGTL